MVEEAACFSPFHARPASKSELFAMSGWPRRRGYELSGVLAERAVACLAMFWEVLNDMERLFDSRAHLRCGLLNSLGKFFEPALRDRFYLAPLGRHIPLHLLAERDHLLALLDLLLACVGMNILSFLRAANPGSPRRSATFAVPVTLWHQPSSPLFALPETQLLFYRHSSYQLQPCVNPYLSAKVIKSAIP
jgi:hypothetical protein